MRALLGLLAAAALGACTSRTITITIGAAAVEPAPTVAAQLAHVLADGGFATAVVHFEHLDAILAALGTGTIDVALVEEPLMPIPGVATLLPVYPSVLHVLRPVGDAPGLPALLTGPIYAGPPGSLGRMLAMQLAGDFGASLRLLDNPWSESPFGYFVFGGLLPQDAIRQLGGFELVALDSRSHSPGHALVDAITLRFPSLRPFTIPADLYPALSREPIRTLAATTFLAARNDLDENVAYTIVQTLTENLRPLRTAYPLAHATSVRTMDPDDLALPLHRGARRYIERDLPSFVERYIEVVAFVTTLTLAAVSGLYGWSHRRKRARKERVDEHLCAVLALRSAIRAGRAGEASAELDRIERNVLELVVTEQVEIGSGLIAFLQLTASLRAELQAAALRAPRRLTRAGA